MSKSITLSENVRAIVLDLLEQQDGKKVWRQKEMAAALSKAAYAFALDYAERPAASVLGKDGKSDGTGQDAVTWKSFLSTYGEHGFAGGNLSQFQQALDGLPETDACHVTRPKRDASTSDYE